MGWTKFHVPGERQGDVEIMSPLGCAALFFGLESVSPSNLIGMNKSLKSIEETEEAIKIIQDNGIAFHPSLILGFDTDTKAIFDDTLEFMLRTKLPTMAFKCSDALSGTRMYQRFKDQGPNHLSRLEPLRPPYRRISTQEHDSRELAEGHHHVQSEFYSFSSILRHIPSLLRVHPINLKRSLLFLLLNIAGKSKLKYVDTSLDWVDNNEKWNVQKIRPDDKVLKGSNVFSTD